MKSCILWCNKRGELDIELKGGHENMIETGKELAQACRALAENYRTVYVKGAFGWPMNKANQDRAIKAYAYNAQEARAAKLRSATDDTFGVDCVCMLKALLWGWNGDKTKPYGGAVYQSNGVPDVNEAGMLERCRSVSTDFSRLEPGELLWLPGHMGIYIGDGLAVEATPIWKDGAQITAVHNLGKKAGYHGRKWTKHGFLPWLRYGNSYRVELPMLRRGMKGEDVRALQILLIGRGYSCGRWDADADFGTDTQTAVMEFQERSGLEMDGIVGPDTMTALLGVKP